MWNPVDELWWRLRKVPDNTYRKLFLDSVRLSDVVRESPSNCKHSSRADGKLGIRIAGFQKTPFFAI